MPVLKLSEAHSDELSPLAPFDVLALMCHPADRTARERMLATVQRGTGVGTPRRSGLGPDEFFKEVINQQSHAMVAGGMLLTLLQLDENQIRPSLNLTMRLVTSLLPDWEQASGTSWSHQAHIGHAPKSRRKALAAFSRFLGVSHLWAALIHGQQHGRDDIWPGSNQTLPTFLAYSEVFASKGVCVPWLGRDRRYILPSGRLWRFKIPENLRQRLNVLALPLTADQASIVNEYRSHN